MANDLKKAGLIFKADGTADFVKSLKKVSTSLRDNYADFKLVQSQYDQNTTTAQKLADKHQYLSSAYDIQNQKLIVLNENLKQLENAEQKDEIAITKAKIAITQAQISLNNYQKQIDEVNKEISLGTANLKDYQQKIENVGDKMIDTGKKVSVLSGAVAAAEGYAVKTSMDLEEATNRYIASTNSSTKETEKFKNLLKSINEAGYGSGYEDIANKISLVKQQMGDLNDIDLKNITENAYLLEDIFGIDFNEVIRGVTGLIKNMGLTADEAFDFITTGAQKGLNKSGELGDNLAEYSQLWGQAGFSAKEMFAILENGLNSGAYNLDKVNDFVKEFTISLSDGRIEKNLGSFSKDTQNLFKEWQNGKVTSKDVFYSVISDLEQTENKQQALTTASEVWSSLGEDNAMAVITSLNDVNKAYDDVAGSTEKAQQTLYSGTNAKAEQMKEKIKNSFSTFGDALLENTLPAISKLADKLDDFLKWFDTLDKNTKSVIVVIGLLLTSLGPVIIALGSVAGGISKIISLVTNENVILAAKIAKTKAVALATNAWKVAQIGLNGILTIAKVAISGVSTALTFLAHNPIILVIAAITALVAGLIYLLATNENFRNKIVEGWTFIQNLFTNLDQFLTGIFQTDWSESFGVIGEIVNVFVANFQNYYNGIKQILSGVIDFVKGVFTGDWSLAWNGIKNIFGGIFNSLLAIAKAPLNGIIGLLNILISGINFLIKGLNKIKFDVPDWVPEIGGKKLGFNIKTIGKIPYMANGGTLLNGAAIVAEAGPELLIQQGNKSKVIPLNNKSKNTSINPFLNDDDNKNNSSFNPTININNYSKSISDAENARQMRLELQRLILKWRR